MPIKYAHTNIVSRDWDALARFYERVFDCRRLPPERNHHGPWIERGTGVQGATIRGVHLALPGHGGSSPTLEIFTYGENVLAPKPAINQEGFGHLAFRVDDVAGMLAKVLAEGGSQVGDIVTHRIPDAGEITLVYVRDPEGNIVELQSWR